jgi:MFS family permease
MISQSKVVGTSSIVTDHSEIAAHRTRLFLGMCMAEVPTAFSFVLVSNVLNQLKIEFVLTNADVGLIGGAMIWGMAISILTIGPLLEWIRLKKAIVLAFCCQLLGVTLFLLADKFAADPFAKWLLFLGSIGFGAGNGFTEMCGNPLVAALYPDQKVAKLNKLHSSYAAGMIVAGLLGYFLANSGTLFAHWPWQIACVYIPMFIYGIMVLPLSFPNTETAEAGISAAEIFRFVAQNPWLWGLVGVAVITQSLELGPDRWIPSIIQSAGAPGILVFVWIAIVVLGMRFTAESVVKKLPPTGMLLLASLLTAAGLYMFARIDHGMLPLLLAGTVFAAGTAYYFPTMVGLMSERFPGAGSLGIMLMIGIGYIGAGASNGLMGSVADSYLPKALNTTECVTILTQVRQRFPQYVRLSGNGGGKAESAGAIGYRPVDAQNALKLANEALSYYSAHRTLDGRLTGDALRALIGSGVPQERALIGTASNVLGPADNYGGRMALFWVAPFALLVAVVFLVLMVIDQRRGGGYKAVSLRSPE